MMINTLWVNPATKFASKNIMIQDGQEREYYCNIYNVNYEFILHWYKYLIVLYFYQNIIDYDTVK